MQKSIYAIWTVLYNYYNFEIINLIYNSKNYTFDFAVEINTINIIMSFYVQLLTLCLWVYDTVRIFAQMLSEYTSNSLINET